MQPTMVAVYHGTTIGWGHGAMAWPHHGMVGP